MGGIHRLYGYFSPLQPLEMCLPSEHLAVQGARNIGRSLQSLLVHFELH